MRWIRLQVVRLRWLRRLSVRCQRPVTWVRKAYRAGPLVGTAWLTLVEERADVGVQYPVHLLAVDHDHQRIQTVVLAAPLSNLV